MKRRIPLIAVLLLALVGLSVALWWSYHAPPAPGANKTPRISDLERAQITRLRVRHGTDQIVIQRATPDAPWHLIEPIDAPVDAPHLEAMLSLASTRADHRYAAGAIDTATTQLDSPALVVQFNHQAPIDIGARGPGPDSRYIQTPHALLLAALPQLDGLHWSWSHWISPALVPPHRRLKKLVLPHFTLDRDGQGHWRVQPAGQRDAAAARATTRTWQHVRALTVVPADQERQRAARVTLIFAHGPPRHLDIIERDPNLILRDPALGVDYHLAGNRVAPLLDLEHPGL